MGFSNVILFSFLLWLTTTIICCCNGGEIGESIGEAISRKGLDSNNDDPSGSFPCIQKLLPCQPYLGKPTIPPPTCCVPMKEMVANEQACLCDVFSNQEFLKSLNITQEAALQLPKACGTSVDISVCKNATTPPSSSPAVPSTPPAPPKSSGSSSLPSNGSSSITRGNAVSQIVSLFMAVVVSALI